MTREFLFPLLRLLPKNHLSSLVGEISQLSKPRFFSNGLLRWFVWFYEPNLEEAEHALDRYPNLFEFFTRRLKAGVRPIGDGLISPVDGKLVGTGKADKGVLLQSKGRSYTLARLLKDDKLAQEFEGGEYFVVYLAPPDYHHIHSPCAGRIVSTIHVPGKLWPVNSWSVRCIDELFCVNERIVTVIDSPLGRVVLISVGATNVGSIRLNYPAKQPSLVTNRNVALRDDRVVEKIDHGSGISISKGDLLASFELGSTVILLVEPGKLVSSIVPAGQHVKLGQRLAQWRKENTAVTGNR